MNPPALPGEPHRGHLQQVDGIRAIAVLMVVVGHWTPALSSFWFNGHVGVQLFFVISGYLITGILLDTREQGERLVQWRATALRRFYIRRFLRIFPVFYATLAVTYLLGFPAVRSTVWWHVAYLSNVLIAMRGEWIGASSHFWSLAVEEQFYLAWPLIILCVPRRHLLRVICVCVLIGPAFRIVGVLAGVPAITLGVLPFASLDTLGAGALLAYYQRAGAPSWARPWNPRVTCLVIGLTGAVIFAMGHALGDAGGRAPLLGAAMQISLAPALLSVVWVTAMGARGWVGRALEFGPLMYIGRISYGIYLLHNFVPPVASRVSAKLGLPVAGWIGGTVQTAMSLAILLGVAALSWRLFEKPINDLKRHFPYLEVPRTETRLAPARSGEPCIARR